MGKNSFDKYIEQRIKKNPSLGEELDKATSAIEVGFQIYTLRKKMGLTQTQLARKIGVSQSNIARIESADYNHYTRRTLDKVAKGLDADLNIFINPPEQTVNFISAGTAGGYFLSGSGIFKREEAITLEEVNGSEKVKVSSESKESKANRFYYQTL